MKALIDGIWHSQVTDRAAYEAARAGQPAKRFRDRVEADPNSAFPAEAGRYHLYVSYACPFSHRAILYRALFGLEDAIGMSVAHPRWSGPDGWVFAPDPAFPEVTEDGAEGLPQLWALYRKAAPDFTGKVTVPVLWDTARKTIVSTESADIVRMLDLGFDALKRRPMTFYPEGRRAEIDALGDFVRRRINAGVYRAGFAPDQGSYDRAVRDLFEALDTLEARLADGRAYLLGADPTEADWLLFPTLVRFDAVYHGALKCNLRRLADYPRLSALMRRLLAWPGVAETVKLDHVKRHYYDDLGLVEPTIVPAGPARALDAAA
ncbi:MAG TPA: glutathione S-transferase C-terminal domain-containing protein [Kiloniellales bacterium]|nr:glutathione S-transferase C-terminal domain-containing protein [Kiloniellales bacterium]